MGGEEFVTLLMDTPTSGALKVAHDLRQGVAALKMHFRGEPVQVTVSCGVTSLRSDDTAEAAMDRADKALYESKHGGRNTCIAA
jgi:diguanylate cyclase